MNGYVRKYLNGNEGCASGCVCNGARLTLVHDVTRGELADAYAYLSRLGARPLGE